MVKTISSYEGKRLASGYHTGHAVLLCNGKYYISTEAGTRPATKKEIERIKAGK